MTELEQEIFVSDDPFEEYISNYYKELRKHKVKVLSPEKTFKCPYSRESREYTYKDLCKHASRIMREPRSVDLEEKANHMALEEYLERVFDANYKDPESNSEGTFNGE